ncbi:MAG: CHAT domain-containing protein, partial [Symploca sp. SIO1C4]|nr:CHAT domain-containing protein [Symploca sp. SIO1C4]
CDRNVSFEIGDASLNGTAGAITTGVDNSILPPQSFPGPFSQGDPPSEIQIITSEPAITGTIDILPSEPTNPEPLSIPDELPIQEIQNQLQRIEEATGVNPAIVYVSFWPKGIDEEIRKRQASSDPEDIVSSDDILSVSGKEDIDNYQLELVLITKDGEPIREVVDTTRKDVLREAQKLREALRYGSQIEDQEYKYQYKEPATKLFNWLIKKLECHLRFRNIENLVFKMPKGLRNIPLAVLFDEKEGKFLVEKEYTVGLIPSLRLTDTRLVDVRDIKILAMGNSKHLNLAKEEIEAIKTSSGSRVSEVLLDENFTWNEVKSKLNKKTPGIIHLATHATFNTENYEDSYINFWESIVTFPQLRELKWNDPPIELLVLSACETSLGTQEEKAEFGFAGLANRLGVKSVLGSLWLADEKGTQKLMEYFYEELFKEEKTTDNKKITKAEALQKAQRKLLKNVELDHPYYWSGFTIIGNPW